MFNLSELRCRQIKPLLAVMALGVVLCPARLPAASDDRSRQALSEISRLKNEWRDPAGARFHLNEKTQELQSATRFKSEPKPGRDPRDVAVDFIWQNRPLFLNPPDDAKTSAPQAFGAGAQEYFKNRFSFELERDHDGGTERNMLFKQRYQGIPVEYSRVSVHVTKTNEIFAAFSNLESGVVGVSPSPKIGSGEAFSILRQHWTDGALRAKPSGELVYVPRRFEEELNIGSSGKARLCWKFHFRSHQPFGLWSAYVDAHSGEYIGAVNELRSVGARVRHYQRDPSEGGIGILSPLRGLEIFQRNATDGAMETVVTDSVGDFAYAGSVYSPNRTMFATLRTTYAVVTDGDGGMIFYSEGGANWTTVNVSSASTSPYGANARELQKFTCPSGTALTSVRFSNFDVGYFNSDSSEGSASDDDLDYVELLQPETSRRLGLYTGDNVGAFQTIAASGTALDVRLVSNDTDGAGSEGGFRASQIYCLVQSTFNARNEVLPDVRFFESDGILSHSSAAAMNSAAANADVATAMALDSSGRLLVAGYSDSVSGDEDMVVWRFNSDGSLDMTFGGGDGIYVSTYNTTNNDRGQAITIDSQGRIIVAGYANDGGTDNNAVVWKLSPSGDSAVATFVYDSAGGNEGDRAYGVALDSLERVIITGYQTGTNRDMFAARISSASDLWSPTGNNAGLDKAFDGDGVYVSTNAAGADQGNAVAVDPSGRIVIAGFMTTGATSDMAAWMLANSSNTADSSSLIRITSHNSAAGGNGADEGAAAAVDSYGKIYVAGKSAGSSTGQDAAVWKLNSDLSLDTSFNGSGYMTYDRSGGGYDDEANGLTLDSQLRLIIGGYSNDGVTNDALLLRINTSGSLDTSFGSSGIFIHDGAAGTSGSDVIRAVRLDSLDRILGAGNSSNGNNSDMALWRVDSNGKVNVTLTNALKHLDEIHAYFVAGSRRYDQVLSTRPAVAQINFGDDLLNAFFDPESDGLYFGKGNDINYNRNIADATDVIYHEYTHFAVDHIYNIANFGHDGAMSEALADFFALDAFNAYYPSYAKTTFGDYAFPDRTDLGLETVRELNQTSKKIYPTHWTGEIHEDSLILSGALWDLRASLGSAQTKSLVRDALFYFPDSFESFYEAMITTSAGRFDTTINSVFNKHGIGSWAAAGSDSLESNDGFATATSLSVATPTAKATIYPSGDLDYYRFSAGAGTVSITLKRPLDTSSNLYFAYGFQVFDIDRTLVNDEAMPVTVYDVPQSDGGVFSEVTSQNAKVTLTLSQPELLYLAVSAPLLEGSNDRTASSSGQYELTASFNTPVGAVTGSRVAASMADRGNIKFTATNLTGFEVEQSTEATLDHVDVLDHNLSRLAAASGAALVVTTTSVLPGSLAATVSLPANFFSRYPGAGSIYLEIFVRNALGEVYSIGFSNEIKLFTDTPALAVYNNVFDPTSGQKATLRYSGSSSGSYRIVIYTTNGDLVRVLKDASEDLGSASIDWDGRNDLGQVVASGIYLAHLEGPGVNSTQKIAVVK
ncbi:MAG: hypothetical protein HY547_03540 [Elusimicrobia bacterium]|nr:hypothetical protein [Elusimicrobiota bacterium]